MSLFSKTPIQHIDYDINPSDWNATNTNTTAKLSLERMKFKSTDGKQQQQMREKPWYVDIPYFLKGIVPEGQTLKVANIEPEIKGRFYGKDPAGAKASFESYYTMIKNQETKKLQEKLKEMKVKKVIKATETAQQILQEGNPINPSHDVTQALSEGETNPGSPGINTNSPFANLQINSVNAPAARKTLLTPEEIEKRKANSKTRKAQRRKPVTSPLDNTNILSESTFTSNNVNALASQRAMASSAERALSAPTSITNPMALQRNKLRAASKGVGKIQPASQSLNKRQTSLTKSYGPSNKSKFQTRKRSPSSSANTNLNTQIATMFD